MLGMTESLLAVEGARDPGAILGEAESRPGISGTAYDTAWLASVPDPSNPLRSRYPAALQWLVDRQLPDGSWGGSVRYEHDRVLCTLAALTPLALFGRRGKDRAAVQAGTRYLWQHGHLLAGEPTEMVGFELLLPMLLQRAESAGIETPPHIDIYERQRAEKLRLIPTEKLYSPATTVVHSLEFLGRDADPHRLREAQAPNGSIGNSPAATAFFLTHTDDDRAAAYLQECMRVGGGVTTPVLHPAERFELLWTAYHLFLAGTPARMLLSQSDRDTLSEELGNGGVSLSATFPIPDADDTAVALLLLDDLGHAGDVSGLRSFQASDGHFVTFPYERHASVGVNVHVLHALLRVPGYPDERRTIERLLEFIEAQQVGGLYWLDKWHISPYYATSHALAVLRELPHEQARRMAPVTRRARAWIRQTQNRDGSWGFYERPTAEETAYAVLALALEDPLDADPRDARRCAAGVRYLRSIVMPDEQETEAVFPPLWIDKCLYTPLLVVRAAVEAAELATARLRGR